MSEGVPVRICAVVPYYDHPATLPDVVEALRCVSLPVIIVDDASPPESQRAVDKLVNFAGDGKERCVELIRHDENLGKGSAVVSGLRLAAERGFTHAVQVDADSQHDMTQLASLLAQSHAAPKALVVGHAIFDDSVPAARYYGRYLTHGWVWINCLSIRIKDSMCGFRVYPVGATLALIDRAGRHLARRMGFDTEICVRAVWEGMEVVNVPVKVTYPPGGRSHFRPFMDNLEISYMHARCFFGMLWRAPGLLRRRAQGR